MNQLNLTPRSRKTFGIFDMILKITNSYKNDLEVNFSFDEDVDKDQFNIGVEN